MREGLVVGISGGMGAGKGLTMQVLASYFSGRGLTTYCNFDSYLPHVVRLENVSQLLSATGPGAVFWDEIDLTLAARQFGKDLNILLTQWMKLIRKDHLRLFWATQSPWFVDVNVRRITHFHIECVRVDDAGQQSTRLDFYKVLKGGEEYEYSHSSRYRHSDALYRSYDTLDKRQILAVEPDGLAYEPRLDVDTKHRKNTPDSLRKMQESLQQAQRDRDTALGRVRDLEQELQRLRAAPAPVVDGGGNGSPPVVRSSVVQERASPLRRRKF